MAIEQLGLDVATWVRTKDHSQIDIWVSLLESERREMGDLLERIAARVKNGDD